MSSCVDVSQTRLFPSSQVNPLARQLNSAKNVNGKQLERFRCFCATSAEILSREIQSSAEKPRKEHSWGLLKVLSGDRFKFTHDLDDYASAANGRDVTTSGGFTEDVVGNSRKTLQELFDEASRDVDHVYEMREAENGS